MVTCAGCASTSPRSTSAGSFTPLLARRAGVDPAVVSAPFITTFVDATGLVIYFLTARVILGI